FTGFSPILNHLTPLCIYRLMSAHRTTSRKDTRLEEYKIIQRLKQGDIGGLEKLVETYQEKAIRTAYLVTQDKALARDVVQATFIHIYEKIDSFDASRPFEPYFMRSVVNAAIRVSQKQQRTISLESFHQETGMLDDLIAKTANPEEVVSAKELAEEMQALLQQLTPKKRAVIVMKYYLGYSEAEIADQLDTPRGTVKSRLHQARQQLKRVFEKNRLSPMLKEERI
ncbi:MAG: sigma-70 family RNA polymerase sigma factor, partial [Chloroflexota bacterium]